MATGPTIQEILQNYKHIAVVGFSLDPDRPSHYVTAYMQQRGYNVLLINPRYAGQQALGKKIYASLIEAQTAGEPMEIVNVFRRSEDVLPVAEEAIKVKAHVLWLQLGIRNEEAGQKAQTAGLAFVQNHCIKVEHSRWL